MLPCVCSWRNQINFSENPIMFAIIWISPLHYICYKQYRLCINPGVRVYILFTSPIHIHIHILKDFLKRWEMKILVYELDLFLLFQFIRHVLYRCVHDMCIHCKFGINTYALRVSWLFFLHIQIDCYIRCLIANIASASYTSRHFASYKSLQSPHCIQLWIIFLFRFVFYSTMWQFSCLHPLYIQRRNIFVSSLSHTTNNEKICLNIFWYLPSCPWLCSVQLNIWKPFFI